MPEMSEMSEKPEAPETPAKLQPAHTVELMVRESCGSCKRVAKQIAPICAAAGAPLEITDVDSSRALAMEFGDRVPVVLVDDEEVACWEIDDDDLKAALGVA